MLILCKSSFLYNFFLNQWICAAANVVPVRRLNGRCWNSLSVKKETRKLFSKNLWKFNFFRTSERKSSFHNSVNQRPGLLHEQRLAREFIHLVYILKYVYVESKCTYTACSYWPILYMQTLYFEMDLRERLRALSSPTWNQCFHSGPICRIVGRIFTFHTGNLPLHKSDIGWAWTYPKPTTRNTYV